MNNFKYSYLHKFKRQEKFPFIGPVGNFFSPVNSNEIEQAEKLIGFEFPKALKEFWLEIGYGCLSVDVKGEDSDLDNYVMQPSMIANIILRKDESEEADVVILSDVLDEFLEEGDIPFMEVSDSSDFLKMRRGSEIVYSMGGRVTTETFELLIWKLYHESAKYSWYKYS